MNEQLKVIISAVVDNFKKNIQDAKQEISSFREQVKKASENVDEDFKKAGESINNGLALGVKGIAAIGAATATAAAVTKEYRENQAKLATAFETAGGSAAQASQAYNDLYRVLGDDGQATEAAAHLAQLTTNEKELTEWTTICQGIYATFGDSLPIEGLTEAANETAKVGTVTGSLADALNWAGISEDAFNESLAACNTEAEREALIRETLNGLYNDAAATYEKNNADVLAQNEAQAKLSESLAQVGAAAQPVLTLLMQIATDALSVLTPYIQEFAANYLPTIKELLEKVGSALGTALSFLLEHKTVLGVMAGIIGGIAAAITLYNAVAAIKAAMDAAQVTTLGALITAQLAHAAAAIAAIAPYLLIVAAIAAVIAIIVLCIKNWDKITAATKKAFEKMKEIVQKGIDAITGFFKKILNWIKENWQGLLLFIVNPFAGAFKLVYDNCEGFRNAINNFIEKIKSFFKSGFNAVKNNIVNPIKDAFSNVKNTFTNIVNTIKDKLNSAATFVKGIIDKIKGFFKFEWSLPKLKVPKFSITPSGWSVGDLLKGSIPRLGVTWNARGGVFNRPTIMAYGNSLQGLGENGAEAVVPLENNLEWLDKLAAMLEERMSGGTPIILQVDGKTFAQTAVNTINDLTKQSGTLPLKIM